MTKVGFIFPGQGAQTVGMGKEFYDSSPEAKKIFDGADRIIKDLVDVTFNGPQDKLTSTAFCQPAIYTFSMAALAAFKAHPKFKNITPIGAAGLSLGEYSALAACGCLSFEETLKLVRKRSAYMEEAARQKKGGMAAVIGFDRKKLEEICAAEGIEVANFNAPDQIVITGEADKVNIAAEKIKEQGAKHVIPLDVAGAFHSKLMAPAAEKFERDLRDVSLANPDFPVLSNVDALPCTDPSLIVANLKKQITSSVRWVETVERMAADGVGEFLEIGPGNVLKGLVRKINSSLTVHNIRKPEDIEKLPY